MSHDAVTLTISTLTGAAVACSLRPRGPTETVVVSEAKVTTATGAVVEGWLTAPHPSPHTGRRLAPGETIMAWG